jgi:RNA polymerase sigma factor (sigma-70 family)
VVDRTDAELLSGAASGDAQAYSIFFRRHVQAVTTYAIRRCATPEDVSDLVGDCFLVALQAAERYRPETETALPWLFGISRRLVSRQRRRNASRSRLLTKASNVFPRFTESEEEAVAAALDAARQAPALEEALRRLSKSEREVLELVAYDGLTPSEAAYSLGITPNAARLRLSRARRSVRESLETDGILIEVEAKYAI